ncbi:3'-5' exonuclease [[Acholeplasma] multilocale]|uniref:3'-5' exonuclease n=1 Tax=[Acholeplasma] multilocale TaxID=264638 RepID=UPI000683EE13|nr:3'-5' exonuclease [[Acholeplasma] multilocale]
MNNKYVLIDFETANSDLSSACQIGIIVVENNQIIEQYSSLIKPEPNIFSRFNISIHHITPDMVADAPTFDEVWCEINKYFKSDIPVIAHNASFDIGVLRKLDQQYNLNINNFNYGCSVYMLKKVFNLPKAGLGYLTEINNIHFGHHDALEDVKATKQVIDIYFKNTNNFLTLPIHHGYRFKKY